MSQKQSRPTGPPAARERKQAEPEYKTIVKAAMDGFWVADRQGRFLDVNDSYCELTGYSRDELLTMSIKDVEAKETPRETSAHIRKVIEAGHDRFETQHRCKDGRVIDIEVSAHFVPTGGGHFYDFLRDVTERKQAEEALRKSEDHFRSLVENAADLIAVLNPDGVITYLSPSFERVLGYKPADFAGKNAFDYIHGDDVPASQKAFRAAIRNPGAIHRAGFRFRARDGSYHQLEAVGNYVPSEGVVINARDVTERRKVEQALAQSEEQYRSTLDSMADSIHVIDRHYRIFLVNQAFKQWVKSLGLNTTFLGKTPWQAFPFLPKTIRREYDKVFKTGKTLRTRETSQVRGQTVVTDTRKIPIVKDGQVVRIVTTVRDVTEQTHAEDTLRQSYSSLQSALEGTVNVLGTIVEIRDPYTAGHEKRVTQLACAIAREMDLPKDQVEGINISARLHDVGKISIPIGILGKPGKISDAEFSLIKNHPEIGYEILKDVDFAWPVAPIILQHHERLDGSGYPHGIKGDKIMLEARILAVADVVSAMSSHRPYRPDLGIDQALEEIEDKSGTLYDPDVVEACLTLFRKKGFSFE